MNDDILKGIVQFDFGCDLSLVGKEADVVNSWILLS